MLAQLSLEPRTIHGAVTDLSLDREKGGGRCKLSFSQQTWTWQGIANNNNNKIEIL